MLGLVAFLFGLMTISYLNSVLLSVVGAVYIVSTGKGVVSGKLARAYGNTGSACMHACMRACVQLNEGGGASE